MLWAFLRNLAVAVVFVLVFTLLVIIGSAILSSCAAPPLEPADAGKVNARQVDYRLTRMYDREARVVCWLWDGYEGDSISCLPLADTDLTLYELGD